MLSTFPRAFQITGQLQEYYSSLKSNCWPQYKHKQMENSQDAQPPYIQVYTLNLNQ